jgi:hypothetical protein
MGLRRSTKIKIAGMTASAAIVLGLAATASGATGAFFSDAHSGTITGSLGTISVAVNGGNAGSDTNFQFTDMLPAVPQTIEVNFGNTGINAEDVWVVFPNAIALSALNDLGHYGQLHITSNGADIFDSVNLNDHSTTCPASTPANPTDCKPLPSQLELIGSLAPGASTSMKFEFNYSALLGGSGHSAGGGTFNLYPTTTQTTGAAGSPTNAGLPYQIVATQVGFAPGQVPTAP